MASAESLKREAEEVGFKLMGFYALGAALVASGASAQWGWPFGLMAFGGLLCLACIGLAMIVASAGAKV